MTSADLENNLKQLEHDVFSLGNMVESAITRSVEALRKRDLALAKEIIKDDQEINHKRFTIEEDCMRIITTNHPEGGDLRMIIAVLGIITELERIGDYAQGNANIALMIGDRPLLKAFRNIPRMAEKGIKMLRGSLASFLARDVENAKRICQEDSEVDDLYDQLYRELLLFMIENPKAITHATWFIWAAHNLERFADRVTNICERVVFSVTGEMVDTGTSKYH